MPSNGLVRCRCTSCRKRKTLRQLPFRYRRPPRCTDCGAPLAVDHYRTFGPELKYKPCDCGEYSFQHRPKGGFCKFNPRTTLEELEERHKQGNWA